MQKGQQTERVRAEAQTVKVDDHGLFNPYANYAYYLLTALLPMMLQMIVMMVTVYVLGVEFRYRQGKHWLKKAGGSPLKALIGKLLPYTLTLLFVAWWMNYLLFGLIGAPLHIPMFNVVLITFALVIIYQIIAITLVSLLPNFRSALTIGQWFHSDSFLICRLYFSDGRIAKEYAVFSTNFPLCSFYEILRKSCDQRDTCRDDVATPFSLVALRLIADSCLPYVCKENKIRRI